MDTWKILVVDDEQDMHNVTTLVLKRLIFENRPVELLDAFNEEEARETLRSHKDIALVLLDVVMAEEDSGLQLIRYIRDELENSKIQIIIRTGHPGYAPVEEVIVDYEVNDYQEKSDLTHQRLKTSVITALRAYKSITKIDDLSQEIENSRYDLFFTLGEIAETRSKETGNHVKRVGEISKILALHSGFSENEAELLKMSASMHDVGKMAISDLILNKPGELTVEEFEVMKTHAIIGYDMLKSVNKKIIQSAAIIAKEHHENYDGSGYPYGLVGEDIQIESRIVAIADVFDALGNRRAYKEPWPIEDILNYMREQIGIKFDIKLMEVFFQHIDELLVVREKYPD